MVSKSVPKTLPGLSCFILMGIMHRSVESLIWINYVPHFLPVSDLQKHPAFWAFLPSFSCVVACQNLRHNSLSL